MDTLICVHSLCIINPISLDAPHCSVDGRRRHSCICALLTSAPAVVKVLSAAVGEAPCPAHSQDICISGGKFWLFVVAEPSQKPLPHNTALAGKSRLWWLNTDNGETQTHTHTLFVSQTLQSLHTALCVHTYTHTIK